MVSKESIVSFRFVHAADLHLDTPFRGIGQLNSTVRDNLRDASLNAFDDLIQFCITSDAAFLLIAGDIYDGADRSVRAQLRFRAGVQELSERGVSTYIVHGNHDPMDGWAAIHDWPPGVHIFSSEDVERVDVERDGTVLASIYGMSYPKRDVSENLALRFRRDPASHGLHIGLLHCTVGPSQEHERYSPCELLQLCDRGMDYWALGHLHRHRVLHETPWVVYSGNLQGRSLKPSELGPKGALLVSVEQESIQSVEFVELDRVRFLSVELDISDLTDIAAIRQALLAETEARKQAHVNRGLLLRGNLRGRGRAHADLKHPNAMNDLLLEVQSSTQESRPFVWWTAIRDHTKSEIDRESIRLRGDFSAELIDVADDSIRNEDFRDSLCKGAELPSFLKSHLASAQWDDEAWALLVLEAEELALDLLESGVQ